ncbi:serine protease 33-like isoform X2 [Paramacrobiotus metropolitanus]|uniref:serine protease 33-like isoform X2 n=1 Tax=Paramacrobiotus metropolitanus TaxID=2943436 RepID=UPI002445F8AC|nr:serine protease 33-like isoform X2 [Paramacrobiotus metropolitanus]
MPAIPIKSSSHHRIIPTIIPMIRGWPTGLKPTITKKAFSLQPKLENGTCLVDYLAIWDLRYSYYPKLITCENGDAFPFYSYSDSVMMLFVSDSARNFSGFQLNVQVSQRCGEDALTCPSDKTKCVQPDYICDGRPDCPKGEDEICSLKCGIPNTQAREQTRIVGGTEAVKNAWPWQAFVKAIPSNGVCGGSLIAPGWIATAGHCCVTGKTPQERRTLLPSELSARLGFHSCKDPNDGLTVAVDKVMVPGTYAQYRWGVSFDYCLLKLNETVELSPTIQTICLPRPFTGPQPQQICTATGCGSIQQTTGDEPTPPIILADNLMVVNLTVIDSTECYRKFAKLSPEMLCTHEKDRDVCQGDSGGPLACTSRTPNQFQLAGLVSFGRGCASPVRPAVYADARRLLPFLANRVYEEKKWGWYDDTAVPLIDHTASLRPFYTPRIVATQTESRGSIWRVAFRGTVIQLAMLSLLTTGIPVRVFGCIWL